ncbi:vacuolar assembly protein-like protein [Phaeosphaeriaceae sp. PMI808]|nr:vacuolar assembly protein-like protein [Phaeosphaeriaceae sp. PMI808]
MAADATENEPHTPAPDQSRFEKVASNIKGSAEHESEDDDDEDDDADEEPKLKYSRLTSSLLPIYRNGDATSTFMVAGDKMIIGTHNGNIHAINIPSFQSLRTYNAHPSASVTALSVSPLLPSQPFIPSGSPNKSRQPQVPSIPSNQIYIASASIDGHVCVSSLVDPKDVTLRNFGRPVQAVALSPDYKSDRSYLSGGLAGELIHTAGGQIGVRSNANTSSASQAAQGWLGAIGLGSNGGKDVVLHSGEGTISGIKWSLSGKFVAWANEYGIRIMRTNLHLDSADSDFAWKRIGFIEKPNRRIWQDMAGVWKARMEWVDDKSLESDDDAIMSLNGGYAVDKPESTLPHQRLPQPAPGAKRRKVEKLVIGWGDAAWIIRVYPGAVNSGKHAGESSVGSAEVVHFLRFDDCVVSGISLYTPSLLLVLAYRTRDDDDNPITQDDTTPRRGMHRRANGLSPELKLINPATEDEVEVDSLAVSRFESLSAADYHLGTLYVPHPQVMTPAQRSALEAIGGGIWDVGAGAARMFTSGASVMNIPFSSDSKTPPRAPSMSSASVGKASSSVSIKRLPPIHPNAATAGLKVFIHSPYDCVLAIKRDLSDHFQWELEHENYKDAWELLEDHPEIIASTAQLPPVEGSPVSTPMRTQGSLHEFFADDGESQTTVSATRANQNSAVEKEKRRIGDLWVQQLVHSGDWKEAGKAAGRVLGTSARWEHWVWKFAQTNHFNEISPYIPKKRMQPPLPSMVYEVVLGHYIIHDRIRFKHVLEAWDTDLYDIKSVIEAIKSKLSAGDVTEDSIEGGVHGRDWRILQDGLAKLFLASGRQREALQCYIRLQNADAAMTLIRDFHLVESVRDDIPGFILMRITKEQMDSAPLPELEEAATEAVNVLVEEGCRGTIPANDVVSQLQKEDRFNPFLFFYLRRLWKPELHERTAKTAKERVAEDRLAADGKIVAEDFADLMVELFAEYDRPLLMEYLRKSQEYDLNKATKECERREYIPELVHILSKTGQTKRALLLIIEKLSDVSFAISFAKEQDDADLWNDLLEYSMDKPHFIRGLLAEVGTAIDPIKLVRRIPEGLEIEGLRDGIGRMVREYEIQHSISEGVARVLRGEVAAGMDTLRAGQKRGVKFEVETCTDTPAHAKKIDIEPKAVDPVRAARATAQADNATTTVTSTTNATTFDPPPPKTPTGIAPPGHCTSCHRPFSLPTPEEQDVIDAPLPLSRDTLVGFACGHVFHLRCLLPKTSASASVAALLQQQLSSDAVESGDRWTRSVGAKVAHAHVVKRAIGKGCVVCRGRLLGMSE